MCTLEDGTGGTAAITKAVELWIYFAIRLIDLPSFCISLGLFGCQSGQSYYRCFNSLQVLRSNRLAVYEHIRNSTAVSVSPHSSPVFTSWVKSFNVSSLLKTHSKKPKHLFVCTVSIHLIVTVKQLLWLAFACSVLTLTFHWPLIRAQK